LRLKEETFLKNLRDGVVYRTSMSLNPKATSMRLIVRDPNSGNMGSLTIPVGRTESRE
jgi:hypothetical protein